MSRTFIVTDSTADIPADLVKQWGIHVVPLTVMFGDQAYLDGVEMSAGQFYERLVQAAELPTTSQPSPAEFLKVYSEILEQHPDAHIVSIHLSSGVSGTYQSARLAVTMLEREEAVTTVDSKSASFGYGALVVQAAKLASNGADKDAILRELERMGEQRRLFFLVDTLQYLQKGGRIGKAAAMIGTLLNIKPILSIDQEGIIYSMEKARGQRKAMLRIVEMLEADLQGQKINVAVGHTANQASTDTLLQLLRERFAVEEVQYSEIGAVIGTHVGPGTLAVYAWPAGDEV
ncbi:DegV family protein [Paenibacillus massiliensis]|uniref:DegV family protein n=1 Tax=Paenibacillus massiliensis TaxID=225917 RepID=UPI000363434A|nr:DegV family protein [Paenibacillus massiliensis]